MRAALLDALAAPARLPFLPSLTRAGYALVLKRMFGLVRLPVIKDVTGIGTMRLEPWDLLDSRLFFFDVWEPAITRFMRDTLKPGMVVADIGANIGYYTLLMSRAVGPAGHVFAIEPGPVIRARLEDNLARNCIRNVTVVPHGISDRAERREFIHSRVNQGASHFGAPSDTGIELRRLADVIPADLLPRLGFIKLDVEGMEAPVMRDIAQMMPQLPHALTICAELRMDEEMQRIVSRFRDAGMKCLALPNLYRMFDYPSQPQDAQEVDELGSGQLDVALVRG